MPAILLTDAQISAVTDTVAMYQSGDKTSSSLERGKATRAVNRLASQYPEEGLEADDETINKYLALASMGFKRISPNMLKQLKKKRFATSQLEQAFYLLQKTLRPDLPDEIDKKWFYDPYSLLSWPDNCSRDDVWVLDVGVGRNTLGPGSVKWRSVVGATFTLKSGAAGPRPIVDSGSSSKRKLDELAEQPATSKRMKQTDEDSGSSSKRKLDEFAEQPAASKRMKQTDEQLDELAEQPKRKLAEQPGEQTAKAKRQRLLLREDSVGDMAEVFESIAEDTKAAADAQRWAHDNPNVENTVESYVKAFLKHLRQATRNYEAVHSTRDGLTFGPHAEFYVPFVFKTMLQNRCYHALRRIYKHVDAIQSIEKSLTPKEFGKALKILAEADLRNPAPIDFGDMLLQHSRPITQSVLYNDFLCTKFKACMHHLKAQNNLPASSRLEQITALSLQAEELGTGADATELEVAKVAHTVTGAESKLLYFMNEKNCAILLEWLPGHPFRVLEELLKEGGAVDSMAFDDWLDATILLVEADSDKALQLIKHPVAKDALTGYHKLIQATPTGFSSISFALWLQVSELKLDIPIPAGKGDSALQLDLSALIVHSDYLKACQKVWGIKLWPKLVQKTGSIAERLDNVIKEQATPPKDSALPHGNSAADPVPAVKPKRPASAELPAESSPSSAELVPAISSPSVLKVGDLVLTTSAGKKDKLDNKKGRIVSLTKQGAKVVLLEGPSKDTEHQFALSRLTKDNSETAVTATGADSKMDRARALYGDLSEMVA